MSRRWTFTLFPEQFLQEWEMEVEPIGEDKNNGFKVLDVKLDDIEKTLWESIEHLRGCFYSLERGDTKEHLHVQGYFELSKPVRWKRLIETIGHGVHLEKANGTRDDNLDYIFHRGQHQDKGELLRAISIGRFPSHQGDERNCYDEAVSMLLEGVTIAEILAIYKGAMLHHVGNLTKLEECIGRDDFLKRQTLSVRKEAEEKREHLREYDDVPY